MHQRYRISKGELNGDLGLDLDFDFQGQVDFLELDHLFSNPGSGSE